MKRFVLSLALLALPGAASAADIFCEYPWFVRNLIFDRLTPPPDNGLGVRPPGIETWINVYDKEDVVALRERLEPLFGGPITDISVDNGAHAHAVVSYLDDPKTGAALLASISSG